MAKRITVSAFILLGLCLPVAAQENPETTPPEKQAAAGAEAARPEAQPNADEPQEMKVLKPGDVPAELLRLKSKADIKCEVTLVPTHGREVKVKGVVRNGKLIERFVQRVFVPEPSIDHPQCGVRLWWVDNTAGWIFLRYSQIRTIALRGVLTAEEKRQIIEALRAQEKEKEDAQRAKETAKLEDDLQKMSSVELEAYLLREYPADQGWNHERLRDLKKKQLIDNLPLSREESIFVNYFSVLIKARLNELKRQKDKIEFEPGSVEKPSDAGHGPGGDTAPYDEEEDGR